VPDRRDEPPGPPSDEPRDAPPGALAGEPRDVGPESDDRGTDHGLDERRDGEASERRDDDPRDDETATTLRREPTSRHVDARPAADPRPAVARPTADARPAAVARPGEARQTATAKRPRRWPRRLRIAAEIATLLVALPSLGLLCSVPSTGKLADDNPTSTAFIDLRHDQAEAAGKPFKLQWQWKPVGKISRYLRAAVVYAEDINFYTHSGVDWGALNNAFEKDWDRGQLTVGGSTITQQLAKNLYLSPNRSNFRKAREKLIAFSLEDHLPKQRILELYLNVVEWGDGIFGAEAASKHWFGHSAISLSPAEAARLAIALPNPIKRAPNVHTRELTQKAVRIIRLFRMQGLIDAEQERAALDQVGASYEGVIPDRGKATPPEPPPTQPEPRASPEAHPPVPEPPSAPEPHSVAPASPPSQPTPAPPSGSSEEPSSP
jgi:monofunctional biosynthetic peptidoglycan transglycosylase